MSDPVFVCFSRFLWRDRFETSRHHLVRGLAQRYRTIYVEPAPNLGRVIRGLGNGGLGLEWRRPSDEPPLRVVRPLLPQVPLEPLAAMPRIFDRVRRAQGRQQALCVRGLLPPGAPVVVFNSFYPLRALGAVDALRPSVYVYQSTDDIAGLARCGSVGAAALASCEREAAARADLVLASSDVLLERLRDVDPSAELLPNGVDVRTFSSALGGGPLPGDMPPGPRLLYMGNIEPRRFDVDLVCSLAEHDRSWSVVLLGPVDLPGSQRARLSAQPNVHVLGAKPRARLGDYLRGADVCLIPYRINALTSAIYPLKLNEYLAAGRPVVATPFTPSLKAFAGLVTVASAATFAEEVGKVLGDPGRMAPRALAARTSAAAGNSWDARVERLARLVEDRL